MTTDTSNQGKNTSRKFVFTDNRIDKLKVPAGINRGQIEYSDIACVGLKLIQSCRTGRKKFFQRFFIPGGKKIGLCLGEFPAVKVELARELANNNKALIAQGFSPVQEREKKLNKPTFQQFAEQIYLPLIMDTKKSWQDDKNKLVADLYPAFGNKAIEAITKSEVVSYLAKIQKRASNSTANRHRALLSNMMNVAIDHEFLEKNVIERIPKLSEPSKFGRALQPEEMERLMKVLDETPHQKSALAIKLLLLTGMRKSECLQIQWSNVDFEQKYVTLEEDTTKGKRARNVVLTPAAMAVIEQLRQFQEKGNPYVFPGSKKGDRLTTLRKVFEGCKKMAGIEDFRLHDCRHNYCSILAANNVSQPVMQELMGHRSPAMTQRYIHLQSSTLHDSAKLVSETLGM